MPLIDSPTHVLVRLALDASALRHSALANNIANASSPGYMPQRVNFEEQLGQARQVLASGATVSNADMSGVSAFVEQGTSPRSGTSTAGAVDLELVRVAQNTLQYQALLRASSRLGTIMSSAINDGRR